MSKPKMTPWFPQDMKPERVGIYRTEVKVSSGHPQEWWQYWNGNRWGEIQNRRDEVYPSNNRSCFQNVRWRGLAEKPE